MEGDGSDEEISVERQIELQLGEQKESLAAINEALDSDPSNPELISVHEELILAIRDAEEGLLHLKRSRLLQEADAIILRNRSDSTGQDVKVETLDSTQVEAEPLESESYSVGSKCRFRYLDGCWYNGHIIGLDNASIATISFLTPTSENMLICKFFLQQRCRFGSNCRMSHGFNVHTSSLKHYLPTVWQQSLVGSSIWAASSNNSGVWKKAELESWDAKLRLGQVVFQDGSAAKLGVEDLSSSEFAQMSDEDDGDVEDDPSSERSESCEEEEDIENETQQGIGFLEATKLQKGIQTETAVFAKWEHHTRGIASKMMASMGYREGMGLGISGQGIIDPITVKVLPPKQSLDHALQTERTGESGEIQAKKRSRGGKRKRGRKFAAAARAAKGEEDPELNVFNFINGQLASHIEVVNGLGTKQTRGSGEAAEFKKTDDRRSLVVHDEKVKELRCRLEKLEEMASRNRNKDKVVYEAASRKLDETRKALEDAEAAQSSASNAFASKEKDKRWLKF